MAYPRMEVENKWRCKAEAVPEAKRGLDLKGLLFQYAVVDHWDSILRQHQGPPSDLPEAQQLKLMVSLQNAYLVSYEHLHVTTALDTALLHLLKPHVKSVEPMPGGGQDLAIPSNAGLSNLLITPQSLIKASMAALFFHFHQLPDLSALLTDAVTTAIQEQLNAEGRAVMQELLHQHGPQFGVTELLWVMASVRSTRALALMTADAATRNIKLLEAKAAGLDMLRLRPDIPAAHHVVGHTLVECLDVVTARTYLEQGLKVADETNSHHYGCLMRFELAHALLSGADGDSFRKGDVKKLVTEGDKMEKHLRKWKQPGDMHYLQDKQQRVHQHLNALARYESSPDSTRLPSGVLRQANTPPPQDGSVWVCLEPDRQGPNPCICNGCGRQFPQLWKCKACRSVNYCSTDCQKAHWKEHKQDCRRIQQDRAAQPVG